MDIVKPPTRQDGFRRLLNGAYAKVTTPILRALQGNCGGVHVMEEDWDNLILLDTCRYDKFKKLNTIPGKLESRNSLGSTTPEFLAKNFHGGKFYDTIYISANAVIGSHMDRMEFFKVIGLWNDKELDDDIGYLIHPELVVEKTLETVRKHPDKRLIIHFLQPHAPFVFKDGEPVEDPIYRYMDGCWRGRVPGETIVELYEENLEFVLSYVKELLQELDGKSIVSADHGEMLGEDIPTLHKALHFYWNHRNWSNYRFGHYRGIRAPALVEVPWFITERGERRNIVEAEAPAEPQLEFDTSNIEGHLEALGYL